MRSKVNIHVKKEPTAHCVLCTNVFQNVLVTLISNYRIKQMHSPSNITGLNKMGRTAHPGNPEPLRDSERLGITLAHSEPGHKTKLYIKPENKKGIKRNDNFKI